MKLRLTKQFSFEMAHALPSYQGKCHNIHGHSYHLDITVEASLPDDCEMIDEDGLVIDFHSIKTIVGNAVIEPYDHALLLPQNSPYTVVGPDKLILTPFQPTTENLLLHFKKLLEAAFPAQVKLRSIRLAETETSFAELIL